MRHWRMLVKLVRWRLDCRRDCEASLAQLVMAEPAVTHQKQRKVKGRPMMRQQQQPRCSLTVPKRVRTVV